MSRIELFEQDVRIYKEKNMGSEAKMSDYLKNCKKYKKYNYKELPVEMLEYLHKTDLKMLHAIQTVFEQNDIKYCAVGGTLLGSVTSEKYIPWDEDIDLAVFEEDYDLAIKCLRKDLPQWMIVVCNETETNYYHEWVKVCDLNSTVFPNNGVYQHQGCWIDIYKLRKMKRKSVEKNIAIDHKQYLKRRLEIGNFDENEYNRRMKENRVEERISAGIQKEQDSCDNEDVYLIGTASKPYVEAKYVFPLKKYRFEDTEIMSFNNAEAYLKNHYGPSFRKMPQEEHRNIAINKVIFEER